MQFRQGENFWNRCQDASGLDAGETHCSYRCGATNSQTRENFWNRCQDASGLDAGDIEAAKFIHGVFGFEVKAAVSTTRVDGFSAEQASSLGVRKSAID